MNPPGSGFQGKANRVYTKCWRLSAVRSQRDWSKPTLWGLTESRPRDLWGAVERGMLGSVYNATAPAMPSSFPIQRHAPQPSPRFPTPVRFQTESLRYAKIRVIYGASEAVGDMIPQYHTRESLGVRIDVTLPYVRIPDGPVDPENGMTEDGYFPIKEFHLTAADIEAIELTGDQVIPYRVRLDRRAPGPFVPLLTEIPGRP